MTFDAALVAFGSMGAGPRRGGGETAYAPVVFRSAPRGPGGFAGLIPDQEKPSGFRSLGLQVAVLSVAAFALLTSDDDRPPVQPFTQLLPVPMADTRLAEPQGSVGPDLELKAPVPVRVRTLRPAALQAGSVAALAVHDEAAEQAVAPLVEHPGGREATGLAHPEAPAEALNGAAVLGGASLHGEVPSAEQHP